MFSSDKKGGEDRVDFDQITALLNIASPDFEPIDIEEFETFASNFGEIEAARDERSVEKGKSHDVKSEAHEKIIAQVEKEKKEEADKMDQQYEELLSAEENERIEAEKKKQEEIQ